MRRLGLLDCCVFACACCPVVMVVHVVPAMPVVVALGHIESIQILCELASEPAARRGC